MASSCRFLCAEHRNLAATEHSQLFQTYSWPGFVADRAVQTYEAPCFPRRTSNWVIRLSCNHGGM